MVHLGGACWGISGISPLILCLCTFLGLCTSRCHYLILEGYLFSALVNGGSTVSSTASLSALSSSVSSRLSLSATESSPHNICPHVWTCLTSFELIGVILSHCSQSFVWVELQKYSGVSVPALSNPARTGCLWTLNYPCRQQRKLLSWYNQEHSGCMSPWFGA